MKKKFKDDFAAALASKSDLQGFAFFTNVDLTPAEQEELLAHARDKGIRRTELFYRERLRILLDSPEGLGFRYQYLGIPLSEAEQAAFFAKFGSELENIVVQGFDEVDRKLARLEFLQSCSKPLFLLKLIIGLRSPTAPEDLGHFRAVVEIMELFSSKKPDPGLWLAVRDGYSVQKTENGERLLPGVKTIAWSRNPDDEIQNTIIGSLSPGEYIQLEAATGMHGKGPFRTIADLDRKSISLFLTRSLAERVEGIALVANSYALISLPFEVFRLDSNRKPLSDWPADLSEEEQEEEWVHLGLRNDGPDKEIYPERRFSFDFEEYTPTRVK